MAIDTAAKRKSCVGLAMPWGRTGVIPDGSNLSALQRLHADFLYAGISAGGGTSYNESGSGGVVLGGSAGLSATYGPQPSCGIVLGTVATVSAAYTTAASGGIALGGSATVAPASSYLGGLTTFVGARRRRYRGE